MTGGMDEVDGDSDGKCSAPKSKNSTDLKSGLDYLREAKRQLLNIVTVDKYFSNKKLVFNFGLATRLKCRLSFCEQSGVWRILIMKPNMNCKPSIISIAYAELDEFIEKLEWILLKIKEGNETGNPYLKPPNEDIGPNWRAERSDNIEFWQKDVFYLSSGRLRMRVQWNFNCHAIFLNNPGQSSTYDKFFGPKIRLGVRETQMLVDILCRIIDMCPPYPDMLDFLDQDD